MFVHVNVFFMVITNTDMKFPNVDIYEYFVKFVDLSSDYACRVVCVKQNTNGNG